MPRSKPGGLTVALVEPDNDESLSSSLTRPPVNPLHNAPPGSSHSTDSAASSALIVPPSPSSPRQASRSFFSGYRNTRLGKSRGPEFSDRLPSTSSSNALVAPGSHMPPRSASPSPAQQLTSQSHGNLIDNLSISDRSGLGSSAASEPEHEQEWISEGLLPPPDHDSLNQRRPSGSRHVFQQLLSRTRANKPDLNQRQYPARPNTGRRPLEPVVAEENFSDPPLTAPLDHDRSYREYLLGSSMRNRSADRTTLGSKEGSESNFNPGTSWESGGMLSSVKGGPSKTAPNRPAKPSKGIFRFMRTGSGNDETSEVALQAQMAYEDHFTFQNITLPIEMQTRHSRICANISDAKDKTEYWLPAILYRCIDFLNQKAGGEEGLYRVPGSIREVRQWMIRFDKEGDVNLLQQTNLYDVNVVGSMLKAYLRDLPSPLIPKDVQDRVAKECAGAQETPQMLKDELSALPPNNYYALFAIFCHLASLVTNSDVNKMTYSNLCICFQPCTKIDPFCFYFLVCEWGNCWQGCHSEKGYYENEQRLQPDYQTPESPLPQMRTMQYSLSNGGDQSIDVPSIYEEPTSPTISRTRPTSPPGSSGVDQSMPASSIYDDADQCTGTSSRPQTADEGVPPTLEQLGFSSVSSRNGRSDSPHQFEQDEDDSGPLTPPRGSAYRGTPPSLLPVQPFSPLRMPPTTRYPSI